MLDLSLKLLEGGFSVLVSLPLIPLISAVLVIVSLIGVVLLPVIVFIICEKIHGRKFGKFPEIIAMVLQFIWTISCVMFMVEEITK